jgi:hypothetical protein
MEIEARSFEKAVDLAVGFSHANNLGLLENIRCYL